MSNSFGTDLFLAISSNGVMDVDPAMLECSGPQVLVQSLVMRQFTPTGSLIGAPDECLDIRKNLSKGMTLSQMQQIGATIQQQLLRDQRVKQQGTVVTATYNQATNTMTITETINSAAGPFTLTISVNALTVTLLLNGVPLGGSGA